MCWITVRKKVVRPAAGYIGDDHANNFAFLEVAAMNPELRLHNGFDGQWNGELIEPNLGGAGWSDPPAHCRWIGASRTTFVA
jgi:hypothetical protein